MRRRYGALKAAIIFVAPVCALAADHYVWQASPNPTIPFGTWTNAAHEIQAAIDASAADDTIVVTNGTYFLSSILWIDKGICLRSVNGASVTTVDASNRNYACVYISHSNAVIDGFTFAHGNVTNTAYENGGGVVMADPGGTIRNCTITSNTAHGGGGVFLYVSGLLENCIVTRNVATSHGGGVFCSDGGTVRNSLIQNNLASWSGGGAYLDGGGVLRNSLVILNQTSGDGGGGVGGGLLENCTVVSNSAVNAGGILLGDNGIVRNSIIYSNKVTGSNRDYQKRDSGTNTCVFSCLSQVVAGQGNTTNSPRVVITASNCLLRAGSPCIDVGTNLTWMATATDLYGQPRVFGARVDMGADEAAIVGMGITCTGQQVVTSWHVPLDAQNQLQYSTNLLSTNWSNVGGVNTAQQWQVSLAATNTLGSSQYFRLLWLRP